MNNIFHFFFLFYNKMEEQATGGVILCSTLLLAFILGSKKFEEITEEFSNIFEPNVNSITVEAFGNQGLGYWDGSANNPSVVNSTGPPIGGTQSASYQLYQQAVNAATPTVSQLENISNLPGGGYGYVSSPDAPGMVPPAGHGTLYDAAAVDFGNRRAELISPCAQNAPTFVASSLLPKINLPGVPSWSVMDTEALANQDFLAPTQQFGVDTVLSSLRNPSYDIRNNIPNPINVVSPWLNSTITPDLQRRPLDAYIPEDGIYGCGASCTYGPNGGPLRKMR
jgi:hypothetical protein